VKINVVIAAAGGSSRAKTAENKIFVKSAEGKPVIFYSVGVFFDVPEVTKIIIAAKPSESKKIAEIFGDADPVLYRENKAPDEYSFEKNGFSPNPAPAQCKKRPAIEIVGGGATRSQSIKNALKHLDKDCKIVLIHDAARPYIDRALVDRVIADTARFGSSVPALPVSDTLKYLSNAAAATVDRKNYFTVSTPQGFFADGILRAYSKTDGENDGFTDDSSVYERYISPVRLTDGQPSNLKITTEPDVKTFKGKLMANGRSDLQTRDVKSLQNKLASGVHISENAENGTALTGNYRGLQPESLQNELASGIHSSENAENGAALTGNYRGLRIGNGYDIHRLVKGRRLILGGVEIPHTLGLDGHSDADALVHSVIDALLSAAGSRDIGVLFPDDDPDYKNADGLLLLEKACRILQKKRASILNISSVIIAQTPKLSPYVELMKRSLSAVLKISPSMVSISCKTNERLGEIGEEKAIAVHSVCLVSV
jgi:2-C-methyl-D-erythritol 2,4-cyclodiphosphate synthase/2-C-methyl-D-erythritol 4-phosphate cytidylyltransferase